MQNKDIYRLYFSCCWFMILNKNAMKFFIKWLSRQLTRRPKVNKTKWHSGRHSQTTFSNAISWMKIYEFRLKSHWCLFLRVHAVSNIPSLFQKMVWCRPGYKPSSEPMTASLPTHICVTRPHWVNSVNYPALVQIMACRLDGAKPLSKPMLEYC